jgi:NAD(P)-dependent dehydrogenase (short-subunit alcohol dehydrogenase family)
MLPKQPKKVCVITGASGGIGSAVARELANQGVSLVLNGRDNTRLKTLAQRCARKVNVVPVVGDVSNPAVAERLFEEAQALLKNLSPRKTRGELNAVFCTGFARFGDTLKLPDEAWHQSLSSNLSAYFFACRSAIRAMKKLGKGHIVNVLSIASLHPFPQSSAYVASKYGALGLTRSLSAEYRSTGIRFTALILGSVNTPLWEAQPWKPNPKDMLSPADVATAIVHILQSPSHLSYDEVHLLPAKGIL